MYIEHDTNDDASRKWRRCVIAYEEGGVLHPFLIESIDIRKGKLGRYYRMSGWHIENNTWTPSSISSTKKGLVTDFPDLGFVIFRNVPVHLYRTGDRQYKKGYCSNTVASNITCRDTIGFLSVDYNSPEIVQQVFNPKYGSIKEVLKGIYNKTFIGAGVTNNIAIAATTKSILPAVYYKGNIVGFINDEKTNNIILSKADISVKEELQEAGFKVEVHNEKTNKAG